MFMGFLSQHLEAPRIHPVPSMAKQALRTAMSEGSCCLGLRIACLRKPYLCPTHSMTFVSVDMSGDFYPGKRLERGGT